MKHLSEVANSLIDPLLTRKGGIDTSFIRSWDNIIGSDLSNYCRPEKIIWLHRNRGNERVSLNKKLSGGILTIYCERSRVLFLMHSKKQIIERVNGFFGFRAIDQIRVIQRSISSNMCNVNFNSLEPEVLKNVDKKTQCIKDIALRKALMRLGYGVFRS
ncbi:hypothetical protein B488_13150 [Liberibacter crescens BT-1]|uniref:Uncharacterized protein n=1 Tax=Liberibacter crescens (strain BT-1) TaxID=1215343 RepID=L0EWG9_LIBCB|nr:DciA family protein [Liberibacter crescens]AGA65307.1 hypothetical protein B488_13150 [Liberibacter crescens BT-1]AMC13238.1 hypothetical protein RL73_06650 [Liberibacter crescens]